MRKTPDQYRDFSALLQIVKNLRGPDGCPWDKEQTQTSLTPYAIEESYELADAIDSGNQQHVAEELGDLLLQVVLHAQIASENGQFDIYDVIEAIGKKMVRRHPHVFADVIVHSTDEVMQNWEQIKAQEKATQSTDLFDIPTGMAALIRSQKIGKRTKKYNFDWQQPEPVLEKIKEELQELEDAMTSGSVQEIEHELGDLLFSTAQLARHLNVDAERSLRLCNQRFEKRFKLMQQIAKEEGKELQSLRESELETFWQRAKKRLKQG